MPAKSVALITTSLRPARLGANVATFARPFLSKALAPSDIEVVPVDLKDFNLPLFNEDVAPAMIPQFAQFKHEHSKAWSAEIAKHDGYVLVLAEYNYGVTGSAKNAIDYLMNEWKGKPLILLSYGAHGGAQASKQAKEILSGMGLRVVETRPQLAFADARAEMGAILTEGRITDESRTKWEAQADEITKAAEELKDLLLQPNDEANVPKP